MSSIIFDSVKHYHLLTEIFKRFFHAFWDRPESFLRPIRQALPDLAPAHFSGPVKHQNLHPSLGF